MKKLFLAFLAVGSIATAQAQKAGSILLYGNAGIIANRDLVDYNSNVLTNDPETRNFAWSVSPGIGFQFNKNWTIGVAVGLIGASQSIDNDPGTGFDTDDKGQPIVKTDKGNTGAKFRVKKLLPKIK